MPAAGGAGDVGVNAVADGEDFTLRHGAPGERGDRLARKRIDRGVRLAGIDDRSARFLIGCRKRARAPDEPVAALDQMIGIGADHRQLALGKRAQELGIVVGRLGLVVEQARADNELGRCRLAELDVDPRENGPVALGPEMEDGCALMLFEFVAGEVARGNGRVIGIVRNAKTAELVLDGRTRPRRVRKQNHDAALVAKGARRGDRAREGATTVMHDAPDIDEPGAVTRAQLPDRIEDGNVRCGDGHSRSVRDNGTRGQAAGHVTMTANWSLR